MNLEPPVTVRLLPWAGNIAQMCVVGRKLFADFTEW